MPNKPFIHKDFLLDTEASRRLYHDYAASMPIIDYHCHLQPKQILNDQRWENISQIWLGGDHYKWRAMRTNGIAEKYCTGNAGDWEKFLAWAETLHMSLRNPVYHWSHLELARYFDIDDLLLCPSTAKEIYERANAKIAAPEFSARGLMKKSNVVLVCTTDDPLDSLNEHIEIRDNPFGVKVLPTWRPDKAMLTEDPKAWNCWVDRLQVVSNETIVTVDTFMYALRKRHQYFHDAGCRLSDYGLTTVYSDPYTASDIHEIFQELSNGRKVDASQVRKWKSFLLYEFCMMDAEKNWTQQLHIGALRNNNTRMYQSIGPDTGFDSISDESFAQALSIHLDRMDQAGKLPRTILYNLNPGFNEVLATMLGNFQDGSIAGKIQLGSGWWFLDQLDGMRRQLEAVSQMSLLSRFVGMLTDSRSFLSYTRHEYFRRLLCSILGRDIENGLIPEDYEWVGGMVRDISYNNAKRYFDFQIED